MEIARDAFNLCLNIQELPGRVLAQLSHLLCFKSEMTNFEKMHNLEIML